MENRVRKLRKSRGMNQEALAAVAASGDNGTNWELTMKIKRLCIISVCISLFFMGCRKYDSKINVQEPVIMGTAFFDNYALVLRLYDGKYESIYTLGSDFGSNWIGQYELVIVDINNNTILEDYQLTEWNEPLCFEKNIDLKLTDYNADGNLEVLIGQYAGNNYNVYRMYYIDGNMQIGYYSEIGAIEISSQEMSPQLEVVDGKIVYSIYDNITGNMVSKEIGMTTLDIF